MYLNVYGFDIIYEYKNYNTPYLYNVFCNGPTVFRESNSALSSRNSHSVDFSNEYGHQIEILKNKPYFFCYCLILFLHKDQIILRWLVYPLQIV